MNKKNIRIIAAIIFICSSLSVFSQTNTSPYIKVISPNGGERWEANSIQTITWQSSGVSKLKIEFSFNYGYSWYTLASSLDASSGQYSWTIPNSQTDGVLIKISDVSDPSIYDISDRPFNLFIGTINKKSKNLNKTTTVPNKTTAVTTSDSVKIWPLGDSITDGEGDDPLWNQTIDGYIARVGWREKLFNLLVSGGYKFRFVGTRISGYDNVPLSDSRTTTDFYIKGRYNDGHGGWLADYRTFGSDTGRSIAYHVHSWLNSLNNNSNQPNVAVFMAGTNDYYNCTVTQVRDHLKNVLDSINTFNSNIKTILAKIIYYHHEKRFRIGEQDTLNNIYLPNLYSSLISSGRDINITDMYSTLPKSSYPSDFSDSVTVTSGDEIFNDVHPNGSGYTLMANTWYTALQDYLPLLRLKVFLQGPYDSTNGLMSTNINSNLPTTSPYQDSNNNSIYMNVSNHVVVPYTIPSDITDWVQIEIRSSDSTTVIESKSCFLRDDGQVIDPDGLSEDISLGITPGNYYVVVKHRNHLAIMSSDLVELNGLSSFDFTDSQSKAFTTGPSPMASLGGTPAKYGMFSGDANGDGSPDSYDNNLIWRPANGQPFVYSTTGRADYNLDGGIDSFDSNLYWRPNNGKGTQVP